MTTETTGQHTPTPWDLQTLRVSLVPVMIRVNGYIKETAEANAAFIVRAVNAHDELVKALRDMLAMVERHGVWGNGPNGQPIASGGGPKETTIGNIICDAARAALADLEGN